MPAYRTAARVTVDPQEAIAALASLISVIQHMQGWGYTISGIAVQGGQMSITTSRTLTAEEREHLGLS